MPPALAHKGVQGPPPRRHEERLARVGVVEGDRAAGARILEERRGLPVACARGAAAASARRRFRGRGLHPLVPHRCARQRRMRGGAGFVTGALRKAPVEVADAVSEHGVAVPAEVLLDWGGGGAVGLRAHDALVAQLGVRPLPRARSSDQKGTRFEVDLSLSTLPPSPALLLRLLRRRGRKITVAASRSFLGSPSATCGDSGGLRVAWAAVSYASLRKA